MKIKFIMPKFSLKPMTSEFKRLMTPPLFLLTLACLTPKKHKVYKKSYSLKNIIKKFPDKPYLLFNLCYREFGKFTSKTANLEFMQKVGKLTSKLEYKI